jgi:hypothetical protein
VKYGLSDLKLPKSETHAYTAKKSMIHQITELKTMWLTSKREMRRSTEKRRTERCSRPGNPPNNYPMWCLDMPLKRNARILACVSGVISGY